MIKVLLGAQWVASVFVGVISFVVSVFIARSLGPELFGVYATAVSVGSIIAILIDGGFSKLLQREKVLATPTMVVVKHRLYGLACGHAIIVMLIACIAAISFNQYFLTLVFAILFFGTVVLNQFSLANLRAEGRLVRDALWQILNRSSTAIAVILALVIGANLPWQIFAAQALGAVFFGFILTRNLILSPIFKPSSDLYKLLFPLFWLDFASTIYFRADMLIFEYLNLPKFEIGHYGVAYRMVEAAILIVSPVGLLLFRKFRLDFEAPHVIFKSLLSPLIISFILAAGISVFFWFFADSIISLAYGKAYQEAGVLLSILGCSLLFIFPNVILAQATLAMNLEKSYAVLATLAAVFNITGNFLLIPHYAIIGAAWMTVLTELLLFIGLLVILILKARRTNFFI